jgi:hypothetical protein
MLAGLQKKYLSQLYQNGLVEEIAVQMNDSNLWVIAVRYKNAPSDKTGYMYVGLKRGGIHQFKSLNAVVSYLAEVGERRPFTVHMPARKEKIRPGRKKKVSYKPINLENMME